MIHAGGCHCGAIRFEVEVVEVADAVPADGIEVSDCNCSICSMSGFLHLIVPKSRFRLLRGEDCITTYRFNTGVAAHTFCRVCGIKAFYTPRSNPDGVDVNLRCLDDPLRNVRIVPFDGRNWELHAATLAGRSRDDARR